MSERRKLRLLHRKQTRYALEYVARKLLITLDSRVSKKEASNTTIGVLLPVLEAAAKIVPPAPFTPYSSKRNRMIAVLKVLAPRYGMELPDTAAPKYVSQPKRKTRVNKAPRNSKSVSEHDAQQFYKSYEWRKVRYGVILKYGRTCMCCGNSGSTIHVDHIKPLRKFWDLRLEPTNLQILCAECNHGKGSWDQTDWRPEQSLEEQASNNHKALAALRRKTIKLVKS